MPRKSRKTQQAEASTSGVGTTEWTWPTSLLPNYNLNALQFLAERRLRRQQATPTSEATTTNPKVKNGRSNTR